MIAQNGNSDEEDLRMPRFKDSSDEDYGSPKIQLFKKFGDIDSDDDEYYDEEQDEASNDVIKLSEEKVSVSDSDEEEVKSKEITSEKSELEEKKSQQMSN